MNLALLLEMPGFICTQSIWSCCALVVSLLIVDALFIYLCAVVSFLLFILLCLTNILTLLLLEGDDPTTLPLPRAPARGVGWVM